MPRFALCALFLMVTFQVSPSWQEEMLAKDRNFTLLSGDPMPMVGFGTYRVTGEKLIRDVLDYALGAGYRMIDSATAYTNEADIGKALKELLPKYNLTRKDIFITSKLAPADQGSKAYDALKASLAKLDCEYIDLYLIHWPGVFGTNISSEVNPKKRDESWQQLARGVRDGLVRNIGVSNYNVRHMKELLANDHGVKPAVNQIEWHPYYHPDDVLDLCNKEGILLEAYSSLGGTDRDDLLKNPQVVKIAEKLGKSPAQVLLRWALQQNIAVIPKARSKARIEENIDLNFVIPEDDMKVLGGFERKKFAWDPETVV